MLHFLASRHSRCTERRACPLCAANLACCPRLLLLWNAACSGRLAKVVLVGGYGFTLCNPHRGRFNSKRFVSSSFSSYSLHYTRFICASWTRSPWRAAILTILLRGKSRARCMGVLCHQMTCDREEQNFRIFQTLSTLVTPTTKNIFSVQLNLLLSVGGIDM